MARGRFAIAVGIVLLTSSVASAAPHREVACRCQGAGRPRRGWPPQRRASGAGNARRPVPDAAGGLPVPFARGPQGYAGSPGEPYIALAKGRRVPGAGCAFGRDVVFALDPDATPGIVRVDRRAGAAGLRIFPSGPFPPGSPSTPSVGSAIAFSSRRSQRARRRCTHSIAVAAPGPWRLALRTLRAGSRWRPHLRPLRGHADCCLRGNRADLLLGPGGRVRLVAESGLPAGGDIGVESVGFVPPKLGRRGAAYLADMGAPGSPTSGSDSLLILTGTSLSRANFAPASWSSRPRQVRRQSPSAAQRCTIRRVADGPTVAHAEGHITFVPRR